MRVDSDDLAFGRGNDLVTIERFWPDIGLIDSEERRYGVPMTPVGDAAGDDPPFDRLRVYSHGFGELGKCHLPL
jgi:hypothetical protein